VSRLRDWARRLKADTLALYFAARDPRTPWYARAFTVLIVAYALSPIDLIPDFVPVLGYLDDLILIPIGIALAIRMTPMEVIADARARANAAVSSDRPRSRIGTLIIVAIWVATAAVIGVLTYRALR
jgi:uncharacterized membrane protein YkvA (DUF1232 family)